jgi:AAA domain, putative AbiEii toxin, Type IV TA system
VRIRSLTSPSFGPERKEIFFGPGVTIVRGANGSGKTIVAELVSLLGHLSILQVIDNKMREASLGEPIAVLKIELGENDIAALNAVSDALEDSGSAWFEKRLSGTTKVGNLQPSPADFEAVSALFKAAFADLFSGTSEPEALLGEIEVNFYQVYVGEVGSKPLDIKEILAKDQLLHQHIGFAASNGGKDVSQALRALIAWNRPQVFGESDQTEQADLKWTLTPRFLLSQFGVDQAIFGAPQPDGFTAPGLVGYVNTDMYDFGAGVDIRESPKELRKHMTETIIDRLQIINTSGITSFPISEQLLKRPPNNFSIMRKDEVIARWQRVFSVNHTMRTGHAAKGTDGHLHWCPNDGDREFVSSGENQAFFVLSYLENLHYRDSILIIDEPEIHLSPYSAAKLVREIISVSKDRQTQAIIVTHLPHLFRENGSEYMDWDNFSSNRSLYQMIHIERDNDVMNFVYGPDAIAKASAASHQDVVDTVRNLTIIHNNRTSLRELCFSKSTLKMLGIILAISVALTVWKSYALF